MFGIQTQFGLSSNYLNLFGLNFVINGKVISLHKGITYVKRNKSSINKFSTKHTPCETLKLQM